MYTHICICIYIYIYIVINYIYIYIYTERERERDIAPAQDMVLKLRAPIKAGALKQTLDFQGWSS